MKKIAKIKSFGRFFYWTVFFVVALLTVAILLTSIDNRFPYKLLTVKSLSMKPEIKAGSLIVSKNMDEYRVGDVITYVDNNKNASITHRIVGIEYQDGVQFRYLTKGDANRRRDDGSVSKEQVLGKMIINVGYLGSFVSYLKRPQGKLIFIVFPLLVFITSEMMNLRTYYLDIKKKGGRRK